jgi:uncharacterized membrane protein YoaK (UPF0700 family)
MHKIRFIENFHIVLWLIKDSCWLVQFKIGGVIMIVPTIGMALYLAWKTRHEMELLLPNLAVCCWIFANAIWMLGEFFDFNHIPYALTSFCLGIIVITLYLLRYKTSSNQPS